LRGEKRAFFFLISSLNVKSLHRKIMLQNPGSSYSYFSNIFTLKNTFFSSYILLAIPNGFLVCRTVRSFISNILCSVGGDLRIGRLLEYKKSDT
jgi:hypothetical protein